MSDLEDRFAEIADRWLAHLDASAMSSNPHTYVQHEAFDELVALGRDAVPLIMERYRDGSLFWGAVLARITDDDSRGDGVTGDLRGARRAWLTWWEQESSGE